MGAEFLFMDDNVHPHSANIVDKCLKSENITRRDWPAYSPDLNPIEHVLDMLGRRIAARQLPPTCLPKLWRALLDEWCNIPQDQIDNLTLSMPRRSVNHQSLCACKAICWLSAAIVAHERRILNFWTAFLQYETSSKHVKGCRESFATILVLIGPYFIFLIILPRELKLSGHGCELAAGFVSIISGVQTLCYLRPAVLGSPTIKSIETQSSQWCNMEVWREGGQPRC
ncbi:DDE_3 domain-containing protein [Trichonephila clavipes]|nr:DDE_3 domain-containing protein [Trichonephila clavipes]